MVSFQSGASENIAKLAGITEDGQSKKKTTVTLQELFPWSCAQSGVRGGTYNKVKGSLL